MKKLTLITLILLVAGAALAQPGFRGKDRPWRQGEHPREMVESFKLFKMTEFLDLSEEQTTKVFPLMADMSKAQEQHREAMREKMQELRKMLRDEDASDREAARLALEIHDLRGEIHARMHEMQGDLMDLLDDEQKAQYIVFENRFEDHVRGLKERMHEGGRRGDASRGGPRGDAPRRR
jgi:Spy/CpxP family protein refolding chaperone